MLTIETSDDSTDRKIEAGDERAIPVAKLSAATLLAWNGQHATMGDKWCPYDIIWIMQQRIVGGRVAIAWPDTDGRYAIELKRLRALFSNKRIPHPEFLAIAIVDRWMRFPIFLHRSQVTKGSVLHFGESDFVREAASERLARCAELLATGPR